MTATILILDDSLTVRMDLAVAFETADMKPLPCSCIRDARDAAARQRIDLAVLDVNLPDGNGVDFLKELRDNAATAALPILMLSSESEVKDRIHGLKTGANDYVGKPYDTEHVVARARELLRFSRAELGSGGAVLVVDDSLTFREAIAAALRRAGHRVLTANEGEAGLRVAAAQRPAAIIVDSEMPGVDGTALLYRLRMDAALRATPCLMLTASTEGSMELRALSAGADAFVHKHEHMDVIMARFAAMLRSTHGAREQVSSLASPKRLLIVDSEGEYTRRATAMLRDAGYDIVAARDTVAAIEIMSAQNVDCILWFDPLARGDNDTLRRVKAAAGHIPLIAVTSTEARATMVACLSHGADDCIAESKAVDILHVRIQVQIRRSQIEEDERRARDSALRSELKIAEARAARELAEARADLVAQLQEKNGELEAFSYSVSHDLRAPLRSIAGFSQMLEEDFAEKLDESSANYLQRIQEGVKRMSALIDDMMSLAQVGRAALTRERLDLSKLALGVAEELRRQNEGAGVTVNIEPGLCAEADAGLTRILFDNLLGNAWKFSSKQSGAQIEFALSKEQPSVFVVRDNGAGFDMRYAEQLFQPFKRLHRETEFPGTGIGLATVKRIVNRHGGRVWAEGAVGRGATIYFTLAPAM